MMGFPFQFNKTNKDEDDATNELQEALFQDNKDRVPTNDTFETKSCSPNSRSVASSVSRYESSSDVNDSAIIYRANKKIIPLSMKLMKMIPIASFCHDCSNHGSGQRVGRKEEMEEMELYDEMDTTKTNKADLPCLGDYETFHATQTKPTAASRMVLGPMYVGGSQEQTVVIERIISEYIQACHFYGCGDRINPGILTTFRFALPSMRVRGSFHDADMLALVEILLKYANGPLRYLRRLDFSIVARKNATATGVGRTPGFASHGAFTLAKLLQTTKYIEEILISRNRIGSYGATALFIACSQNPAVKKLDLRHCRIGERGGFTFAEYICPSEECGLLDVDLSCNQIGYHGCQAIESALTKRNVKKKDGRSLYVDLDANLIFQEVLNSVTHGLGIILVLIGTSLLMDRVKGMTRRHYMSCSIYSASLLILYMSSTLYHSFFSLRRTQQIFRILDKSAIYILIAGSYTPFLQIVLSHEPLWSFYLLMFLWSCCAMGIIVEFACPRWKYKGTFSLFMYLAMGWSALICLPEVTKTLPQAIPIMILGGVCYTGGVPFFVRSNNLDHAIWHLFVLAGSVVHWFGIYYYVAPFEIKD